MNFSLRLKLYAWSFNRANEVIEFFGTGIWLFVYKLLLLVDSYQVDL